MNHSTRLEASALANAAPSAVWSPPARPVPGVACRVSRASRGGTTTSREGRSAAVSRMISQQTPHSAVRVRVPYTRAFLRTFRSSEIVPRYERYDVYTRVKCEYLSPKCTLLSALHSHSLSSLNVIDSSYDTRLGRLPIYLICPCNARLALRLPASGSASSQSSDERHAI